MIKSARPIPTENIVDQDAKKRISRTLPTPPFNKRTHSVGRVTRRKSPGQPKKGRCQSWSSSSQLVKSGDQLISTGSEGLDPQTYQMLTDAEGKNHPVPQCVVAKISRVLSTKKREFVKLRKNLISQQNTFLQSYAQLREIETRAGVMKDEVLGDVNVLSVTGWPAYDLLLLVRDDLELPLTNEIVSIFGAHVLQQISAQLNPIPDDVLSLCTELMVRRLDLLNMLRSKHRLDRIFSSSTSGIRSQNSNTKAKNLQLDEETENLQRMVAGAAENLKAKVNYILELAKIPWVDRDATNKKIERLQKENTIIQNKLEMLSAKDSDEPLAESGAQALGDELSKERAAREALKEVVASAESMLRVARTRISALERQLKKTETELENSKKKHKETEHLVNRLTQVTIKGHHSSAYRQRETSYDVRSKKLLEVSKTGEITIDTLSRQRDALEIRVKELHEQAEQAERAARIREAEQRSQVNSLQAKVAEQEKMKITANNRIIELETRVKNLKVQLLAVKQRSTVLMDLDRSRCLEYIPPKVNEPTERETEVYKELQSTRMALSNVQEELRQSRAAKDSFLDSLAKIARESGSDKVQERIATELLNREKEIDKLQRTLEDQREHEKVMEKAMTKYENQIAELRLEVKRLRCYDCYSKDIPNRELHTEMLEMQMKLDTMTNENTALMSAAASRALMLERHEHAADFFTRMIRARRELCNHLNESGTPKLNSKNHVEASRSLSVICSNAANTWSSLRAERAHVRQLESIVLAQNMQLEREAQVRTQLEKRRAMFERNVSQQYHSEDRDQSTLGYSRDD